MRRKTSEFEQTSGPVDRVTVRLPPAEEDGTTVVLGRRVAGPTFPLEAGAQDFVGSSSRYEYIWTGQPILAERIAGAVLINGRWWSPQPAPPAPLQPILIVCHGRCETDAGFGNVSRLHPDSAETLWTYDLGERVLTRFHATVGAPATTVTRSRRASRAIIDAEGNIFVGFDYQWDHGYIPAFSSQSLGGPGATWDEIPPNGGMAKIDKDGNLIWLVDFPAALYMPTNPEGPMFWYNIIEPYSVLATGCSLLLDANETLWCGTVSDNAGNYLYQMDPATGDMIAQYGAPNTFQFPHAFPDASGRTAIECYGTGFNYGRVAVGKIASKDGQEIVFSAGQHPAQYNSYGLTPYNTLARMDLEGNVSFANQWRYPVYLPEFISPSSSFSASRRCWLGLTIDPGTGDVFGISPKSLQYNGQVIPSPYQLGQQVYLGSPVLGFPDFITTNSVYGPHVTRHLAKFTNDPDSVYAIGADPLYDVGWKKALPDWTPNWAPTPPYYGNYDWANGLTPYYPSSLAAHHDGGILAWAASVAADWVSHTFQTYSSNPPSGRWLSYADNSKWNIFGATTHNGTPTFAYQFAMSRELYPGRHVLSGNSVQKWSVTGNLPSPPTQTASDFVMPSAGGTVAVTFTDTSWMAAGTMLRINVTNDYGLLTFTVIAVDGAVATLQHTPTPLSIGSLQNFFLFANDISTAENSFIIAGGYAITQQAAGGYSLVCVERITLGGERIWIKELAKAGVHRNCMAYSSAFRDF
ncbi:MAG: hypothetical protein A3E01_10710 [Gammaproteobacteria bacterium RIFCSPHIGHO2_12_FULL_63_22]|nr:MAG: hypothetical protein A3E01_10710 [Gammaproteobacteria bacterium RIFCSPHIGHO2_12_FULL_63_22]